MHIGKALLLAVFMIGLFQNAGAALAAPSKRTGKTGNVLHLNPQSLEKILISANNSILQELNNVYIAKTNVNIARANLLPSLALGTAYSGSGFVVSSAVFLVPFIMPSNWFNLRENQRLLDAEVEAYYILELNQYASAYSIYTTVVNDKDMYEALKKQYDNLKQMEGEIEMGVQLGIRPVTDLYSAQAQTATLGAQVGQIQELLKQEIANLRQMLSLPLTTDIELDSIHPSPISVEGESAKSLYATTLAKAPENKQIDSLIAASRADRWSKVFSFFNSNTVSAVPSSPGGSVSFGHLTQEAGFNFGFAYFPAITLSSLNIREMELRKDAVGLEQAEVLESSLASIQSGLQQLEFAKVAEKNYSDSYDAETMEYKLGTTDFLHVLTAANLLEQATVTRVKTQTDLDSMRITLNRTLLREIFARIPECKAHQVKGGLVGNIFRPTKMMSLDQLCGAHPF